jgi:hypothetical protein
MVLACYPASAASCMHTHHCTQQTHAYTHIRVCICNQSWLALPPPPTPVFPPPPPPPPPGCAGGPAEAQRPAARPHTPLRRVHPREGGGEGGAPGVDGTGGGSSSSSSRRHGTGASTSSRTRCTRQQLQQLHGAHHGQQQQRQWQQQQQGPGSWTIDTWLYPFISHGAGAWEPPSQL